MHMISSRHISSTFTVPLFKFKFLYYAPHKKRQKCVLYGVFYAHENRTYSDKLDIFVVAIRSLHISCPPILVFMFKNYIPHTDTL